jgi:hypothetical protein
MIERGSAATDLWFNVGRVPKHPALYLGGGRKMKKEVGQIIGAFCIDHCYQYGGRAFVFDNASYIADLLNIEEKEVIGLIPPEFYVYADPEEETEHDMIIWGHLSEEDYVHYGEYLTQVFDEARKHREAGIRQFVQAAKKLRIPLRSVKHLSVAKVQAGRQGSAPKNPPRTEKKTKSGDGKTDPDPEPPRQLLYTFKSFAQLVDCSEKTLRNKVSAGLFPQPQKTAFGPRFTQQHLDFAVTPPAKPARGRGRPRIADLVAGGVQ